MRAAAHPKLGVMLDSFHVLAQGEGHVKSWPSRPTSSILSKWRMAAARPALTMPVDQWGRHHRCFPGKGTLAVAAFAAAARRAGYQGVWSLEIFNDRYRQSAPASVAAEDFASLQWLQRQVEAQN